MDTNTLTVLTIIVLLVSNFTNCCDLEDLFSAKEISIEDALEASDVVFRGFSTPLRDPNTSVLTAYFDLVTVYKGEELLNGWRKLNNYFR